LDFTGAGEFQLIPNAETDSQGLFERPVLPLSGLVIYPNIVAPVTLAGIQAQIAAEKALDSKQTVIGIAARDISLIHFEPADLYQVGVELALSRVLHMTDDSQAAVAQGRRRVQVVRFTQTEPYLKALVRVIPEDNPKGRRQTKEMHAAVNLLKRVIDLNETIPDDVLLFAMNADSPGWLADLIAATLLLPVEVRQELLEEANGEIRLARAKALLSEELNALEIKDEISGQIQQEMDRAQREMFLREQLRIIQTELGEVDAFQQELEEIREQIERANLPPEVHARAMKEWQRLSQMPPMAPEVGMVRTYIDWLTELPWTQTTVDQLDVRAAQRILDREHYGLKKVKDRILEYIAVKKLAPDQKNSPILCFVGPPGVGKTSLGKSIAEALGRHFVRVSLGGIRDEAEIRGHRRTYVGALPGRIIQTMKRAETINPVFMLDEIDKMGVDFRGDPSSALLEVLDPEQNNAFSDHYLEVPYDLSRVMFITTANDIEPIPPALLDRLEIIEFSSYTDEEKVAIARQFLIPKQMAAHGLTEYPIQFETPILLRLINEYTYEAGVRNLNREIASIARKIARQIAEGKRCPSRITKAHLTRYLGPAPFDEPRANEKDAVGVSTGLAWTPFGGDILTIEVSILPGKGTLLMTGSLGEVMQESAQTALSYMRANAERLDVEFEDFENFDVHVHLPEGATPKDGPSAGITLAVAMISAFTERKVRADIAMTGEITLRGKVLPVGGIKEKLLAAQRARLRRVIIPKRNQRDLLEVPKTTLEALEIIPVETMDEVIEHVLLAPPSGERLIDRIRREKSQKEQETET
jgi:ATP-dependent Lon protease